ncbi:MAG: hypothetical protein DRH44_04665 [Candidatus Coatesbacteria bacterium]|nr:MAG: hypothetical protein DRH49_04500 [Candidatus Coatesbacteria bacterium]RLC43556.1 MAG: hypothetical protein DRH44_04665 [Candidatus Coatesbacteria bacterium]
MIIRLNLYRDIRIYEEKIMRYISQIMVLLSLPCISFSGMLIQGSQLDIPVGYTLENTVIEVGISSYLIVSQPESGSMRPPEKNLREMDAFLMVGLLDRIEVGFRYYDSKTFGGFVKAQIWKESAAWPAISVGLSDLSPNKMINSYGESATDYYHSQNNSFFVAVSKDLEPVIRVPLTWHIGVGSGRFQGVWRHSIHWQGIFGGIAWRIKPSLRVVAELDGRDFNAGIIWDTPYKFRLSAGVSEIEQLWWGGGTGGYWDEYDQPKFNVSVSYFIGPLIGGEERARLQRLKNRIERAQERLKQAKDRRESVERAIREIEDELID